MLQRPDFFTGLPRHYFRAILTDAPLKYRTWSAKEDCFLGKRGSPRRNSASVRELIIAPIHEHSRKPDEIYERIEQFCGGPYLELFARNRRPGWVSWGDQVDLFSEVVS